MKKIAIGLGVVLVVALAAALGAPSFIDWTRYRVPIAERLSALTGREVRIRGAIAFHVLPEPQLAVADVSLANLPGAGTPEMVRMKSLTVRVALLPLLGGRISVESVTLVQPVVRLEVLADGRKNWTLSATPPANGMKKSLPLHAVGGLGAVRLDSVNVRDGTVIYSGGPGKKPLRFEKIDAGLSARTLAGPYLLQGRLVASGLPFSFRVDLGRWTPDHQAPVLARLHLLKSDAHLTADGVIVQAFGRERFNGSVKADGTNFADLIETLSGVRAPRLDRPFKLDFQATGDAHEMSLNDIGFQFDGNAMTGAATIAMSPAGPKVSATLAVGYLNLDSFLSRTGGLTTAAEKSVRGSPTSGKVSGTGAAVIAFPSRIPTGVSASVDLRISVASFHGGVLRDMRLAGGLKNGQITIQNLGALLPGASTISLSGATSGPPGQPEFSGQLAVASADVRALLTWLGVDADMVPPGRLTIFSAHIPFTATPQAVTADQIDVHLDQSHVTGQATLDLVGQPALGLDLALDRIDLDDYLPLASAQVRPGASRAGDLRPWTIPVSLAALSAMDTNLKLRIGEVVYRVVPINGVTLDLQAGGGALDVKKLKVANAGGASLALSGGAADLAAHATYQGTFAVQAPGIGVFARLSGLAPPPAWIALRGLKVAGKVSGDASGFELSGLDVALGPDEAGGDIEIRYAKPRPKIRANLTVANLWLDPFLASAAASGAPATAPGGAPIDGPIWSRAPFDLGPFDWADGIAAVSAKQITIRGYQVRDAEITATVNDGAVTLNPIRAVLLDGALAAKAHIAAGADPSIDVSFVWKDLDLRRLVFGLTGLGALSGRGSLNGTLQSSGPNPAAVIANLGGRVALSVDKGAVQGLDLARLDTGLGKVKTAAALIALSDAATSGGSTPIATAQGTWAIAKGIARTGDTEVGFPDGTASLRGELDLPSWSMNLASAIRLTRQENVPPLGVTLSGAISDPVRRLDTAALEQYVAAAAKTAPAIQPGPVKGLAPEPKGKPAAPAAPKAPAGKPPAPPVAPGKAAAGVKS